MPKSIRPILFFSALLMVSVTFTISLATPALEEQSYFTYLPIITRPIEPQWIGPDGGSIVCLAISPSNPEILYAGTWGAGVYQSTNGGATWKPVNQGLPNLQINAIAVDPQNPAVVYVGPYREKLYKSTDGGQSWHPASAGLQDQAIVYSIAIDFLNTNRLYIATRGVSNNGAPPWNGRIYRSEDGGASWSESLINVGGVAQQDWAYSLAVNPVQTNEVYAALHEYGVYKSTNYGLSWAAKNNGIALEEPDNTISGRVIAFDPQNTAQLFFGVWHGNTVFRTDNGAQSWARYNQDENNNPITPAIYNLAVDPKNSLNVYLATFDYYGVLKSFDLTYRWRSAGLSQDRIYTVAVHPQTTSIVFAGTYGDGLYRSTNGAASWSHYQAGITNSSVRNLVVLPNGSLYAAIVNSGVSRSLTAGQSWQDFNTGLPEKNIQALVPSLLNPNRLFAATNSSGLYYVDTDLTTVWTKVPLDLPASNQPVNIYGPDHPFADREDLEAEADPTLQYDLLAPLASNTMAPITAIAFSPSNKNIGYLGVYAVNTPNAAVYRSTDGGIHWDHAGLYSRNIWALAVSPQNPNVVYAASTSPGTVFYTTDGGSAWSELYLPPSAIYSLAISTFDPNRVYAGTSDGIYVRVGSGNWTKSGLQGISITALATDPAKPNVIYAGTNKGVYISADAGQTWSDSLVYLPTDTIQSISFDPTDARWVYFGTLVRGAVKYYLP